MSYETKKESQREPKQKSTLRRLVVANLLALLALVTISAAVLFAFGLLGSIFEFIF